MNIEEFKVMMGSVCDDMAENEAMLCELDGFVGDGDHGVTISRGFLAVKELLLEPCENMERLCVSIGDTLALVMGGAIGPIFGSIFTEGAVVLNKTDEMDTKIMTEFMQAGLEGVMMLGGAAPGDRTMVDALWPAVEKMKEAVCQGMELKQALYLAAEAAKEGAAATARMTAKKGRAKFLGERSMGYQDAGATSISILISSMAKYCI